MFESWAQSAEWTEKILFTHPSSQIMIIINILRLLWGLNEFMHTNFNTMALSKWQICALTNVTVAIIFVSELILGLILFME